VRVRPETQEWYFFKADSDAGLKAGPFSWDGLLRQAEQGTLEPTDVVWDPTSGWQTAAKVSGLFSAAESAPVPNGGPEKMPPPPYENGGGRRRFPYWIAAAVALLVVAVGLGVYFGIFYDRDGEVVTTDSSSTTQSTVLSTTTSSAIPPSTTESSVVSTTSSTSTSTTTTVNEEGSGDEAPAVLLGKAESGHEVFLQPGERVRVELKPYVGDRVKEVRWTYSPSDPESVTEVDSGVDTISDIVVECWLELEAVTPGPVTVRAQYVYPNGTSRATWVIYLFVIE